MAAKIYFFPFHFQRRCRSTDVLRITAFHGRKQGTFVTSCSGRRFVCFEWRSGPFLSSSSFFVSEYSSSRESQVKTITDTCDVIISLQYLITPLQFCGHYVTLYYHVSLFALVNINELSEQGSRHLLSKSVSTNSQNYNYQFC